MKAFTALPLLVLAGCGGNRSSQLNQPIVCTGGDVPIYSNRFAPQAGSSGVATGADAAAGKTNSDPSSGDPSTGGVATAIPGTPASPPPAPSSPSSPPVDQADLTAMTVTCGQANCAPGQVAVLAPPMVASPGSGGSAGAPPSGPATTTGVSTGRATSDSTGDSTGDSTATPPAAPQLMPEGTLLCAAPPPSCPAGQSPQYTSKGTWECTDCSLVVTYGGLYGNYRRCVSMPNVDCSNGEVPTWVFEDEQWECKTKCDNGQYDQHTIQGTLVCVPC
jgi:hypothetical protein